MKIINFSFIKIKPTLNNIFITITDQSGNVLTSQHAGSLNFKGSKKKTPYVAGLVIRDAFTKLSDLDIKIKTYIIQIQGNVRTSAINNIIKQIRSLRIKNVFFIQYINKQIHGNIRLKKKRRL